MTVSGIPSYTAPADGRLTDAMRADYADAGVLVLENFVSAEQCRKLQQHTLALIDAWDAEADAHVFSSLEQTQLGDRYFEESGDKIRFFFEIDAFDDAGHLTRPKVDCLNKIGHAMHDLDPVFEQFSRTPTLENTVASLGYRDPLLLQSMYIFKPPGIGGEVHCHQDNTYLYTEPESCTGFWFALEDATTENGCMQFIPGGHKGPLKELQYRDASGKMTYKTLDDTLFNADDIVPAEAPIGTLVIFDGRSPHYSGPNHSPKSRHAYTLHVIERSAHYPAENWLQRGPDLPLRGF